MSSKYRETLKPEPQKGDIVQYHMREDQKPANQYKIWEGRITDILVSIYDRRQERYYAVNVINEGFEDCTEVVYPSQVCGFQYAPVVDAVPTPDITP